jgi:hypothetical protein
MRETRSISASTSTVDVEVRELLDHIQVSVHGLPPRLWNSRLRRHFYTATGLWAILDTSILTRPETVPKTLRIAHARIPRNRIQDIERGCSVNDGTRTPQLFTRLAARLHLPQLNTHAFIPPADALPPFGATIKSLLNNIIPRDHGRRS